MKNDRIAGPAVKVTLQTVMDQLQGTNGLSDTRKRDLRSAIATVAKLTNKTPAAIPLDLAGMRQTLEGSAPAHEKVSRKRWANLRSDLAAAVEASGLRPMLKTAGIELDPAWVQLLEPVTDRRVRNGLSRFARWATLRQVGPQDVCDSVLERYVTELENSSLIRTIAQQHRNVVRAWTILRRIHPGLQAVAIPPLRKVPTRVLWEELPAAFKVDVDRYLEWCAVPDPLDDNARTRALAPRTVDLRRDHIQSAVSAARAAGIDVGCWTSLASLTGPETFRSLLRQRWSENHRSLSAYTHGLAGTLIAIAAEWVRASAETVATLKALRSKLGPLPPGLTEKNSVFLRKFADPRLVDALIDLPDRLWRRSRKALATSRRPFIDLQSALAIDLLIHIPLRMENLAALNFEQHLHWPQGHGKPAFIAFGTDETKNNVQLEFEIPAALAERFYVYRNEIAPAVTGQRPDAVFVAWTGRPRGQAALTTAIEKAVLRNLGVKLTPHQFRHLAAKLILDANPGAFELVRQLLGHRNLKTTTNFYAGIDTRRAGRAHADLVMKLRESRMRAAKKRTRAARPRED